MGPGDPVPEPGDALDGLRVLIRQMRELDRTAETETFFVRACGLAGEIADEARRGGAVATEVLLPLLDDRDDPARLRAAFTMATGWGCDVPLVDRARDAAEPVVRQGALLGLATRAAGEDRLYGTWDFFERSLSLNKEVFRLALSRGRRSGDGPDDLPNLLEIARNDPDLSVKEMAVLVAGQDVDRDERVFSFCSAAVGGEVWRSNDLAHASLFVLSHSQRPEAAASLLSLAHSMQAVPEERLQSLDVLAALLERHPGREVMEASLQSIADESLMGLERAILMFSVGKASLDEDLAPDAPRILDVLGTVALGDGDRYAQLGAMLALSQSFDTQGLPVLEAVFLRDDDPWTRQQAASLLQDVADDDRAAFEILRAGWAAETDPLVREAIVGAVARLEPGLAVPFLRSVLAGAPGGQLERRAREALDRLEGD